MRTKGFTLIELLVVISIIGVLSSVVMASLNTARAKARDAERATEIAQIARAVSLYMNDNNNNLPSALLNTDVYTQPYYPGVAIGSGGNVTFAQPMLPYLQPVSDPHHDGTHFYYIVRPSSSWITTNSWANLTASCAGKPLIVAYQTETSGKWRQDCPGGSANMIIISVE